MGPHHRRFETRMVSNRNNNTNIGTTTKHRGGTRCGYFFTTTTILWQYSNVGNLFIMSSGAERSIRYHVALQRVPTRCYRDGSERVCWKLTFIQIIPSRPLWLEAVELTYLASTYGSAHRAHHSSQTN